MTRPTKMMPVSLLTLPPEIVLQICGQFCLHCRGEHKTSWDTPLRPRSKGQQQPDKSRYSLDRHALFCLSLVCKKLRDISQPVLYHEFALGYDDSYFSDKYWSHSRLTSFMRTLASRHDLAELVHTVYISPYLLSTFGNEQAQAALIESARSLGIDLREAWEPRRRDRTYDYMPWFDAFFTNFLSSKDASQRDQPQLSLNPLASPWADCSKGGRPRLASEIIAMLLAQLPNLHHFNIRGQDDSFYGRILLQALTALKVSTLPLKKAEVKIKDMSWIQLATGLEELDIHSQVPKQGFACLPQLKILRIFKGVFSEPEIKNLISACTGSLCSFSYEAAKPWDTDMYGLPNDHFQPSDIINHLNCHRETLKLLHIDLFAQGYHIRGVSPELTLQDFTALQHLFLTSTAIYDESSLDSSDASESETLLRFIPSSLVSLSINGANGHRQLEEGLFSLAHLKQSDPTQFPNLRQVRADFKANTRALSSMFEAAGVNFSSDVVRSLS